MQARALMAVVLVAACGAPDVARKPAPAVAPAPGVSYTRDQGFEGAARVRFSFAGDRGLFSAPWPSEMRRRDDGRVDLTGYPGRDHFAVSRFFDESEEHVLGFSVAPVIYIPIEGTVDDALLGKAVESGAVRLIDLGTNSPTRGEVIPLRHHVYRGARHVPDGTLALRAQQVLRPDNVYLALVLRTLSPEAEALGTTADLERIKNTVPRVEPALERARKLHAEAFEWLHDHGVDRSRVGGLALFRTQPALDPLREVIRAVEQDPAARPKLLAAEWMEQWDRAGYRAIRGYYCTPNFQTGVAQAPYTQRGGIIERDGARARVSAIPEGGDDYVAACGGRIRARFVLTVPTGEMPDAGWPLMVYAHGTTGDATSMLGDSQFGATAARVGMASVSTDQPLHGSGDPRGARPGSSKSFAFRLGPFPIPLPLKGKGGELAFYNALRPVVLRDNLRQAIADGASLARLILHTDFATATGAEKSIALPVRADVAAPRFNASLGYVAAGHSQGTQSMAPLGALDSRARATLLSACGGDFSSAMLLREDSKKVRGLVELVLGLAVGELDEFHPFATAMQSMLDPIDPQTFGALYRMPPKQPRSALLISGVGDSMTPDGSGAALTLAMGLDALSPLSKPIPGLQPQKALAANGADHRATLALLQLSPSYDYEPHFVAFREAVAVKVMEQFLKGIASGELAPRLAVED